MTSTKITPEHLRRGALVYVRQSSMGQVLEHTESQRRQYALAETARSMGFASVATIDDDLGRSGSGLVDRPGFQRLVASVCSGLIGAVFCIEASRLARNGRDWHHLIDLCALAGTLVIDTDGVYEPRQTNDRLLLGLKGTMSEYELSLLQQRGQAARDSKAKRGELRFRLPAGYCWNEVGVMEFVPDARIVDAIKLVFKKFVEFGSARQVLTWMNQSGVQLPIAQPGARVPRIKWKSPCYENVLNILRSALYAGAYVFGRTGVRTTIVNGRAKKTVGHRKPRAGWSVLIRDHHAGYITWAEYEKNQTMLAENTHVKKHTARKSGRGGRALLTGLLRCARCARMMRVSYGRTLAHSHRYQSVGSYTANGKVCIGIGGMRVDRAVVAELLELAAPHAIDAALAAADRALRADDDVRHALRRQLEEATYDASLAARRHEAIDPAKRLVASELEARWEATLANVKLIEERIAYLDAQAASPAPVDRAALLGLAHDLHAAWNAPTTSSGTKQRIVRILVHEVLLDLDGLSNDILVTIHWTGGRHTELRVRRVHPRRHDDDGGVSPVDVMRKMGGQFSDRDMAATMNRMRCIAADAEPWTTDRVRELRERLGISPFDPAANREELLSINEASLRLSISISSVRDLIRNGVLPGAQAMKWATWRIPANALDNAVVTSAVRKIVAGRRPRKTAVSKDKTTLQLPGV